MSPASLLPLLARNCMRLQVLELDHVSEITQEVAAEVCREGLKGLEMLVLTATPVTPKALLHFNSEQWEFRGTEQGVATACPWICLEHFATLSELFLETNSCLSSQKGHL